MYAILCCCSCQTECSFSMLTVSGMLHIMCRCAVPVGYPRVVEQPTLKAVEKDRHTVMACDATGEPEPIVTWLKDFIPVDVTDPRLRLLPTGMYALTIISQPQMRLIHLSLFRRMTAPKNLRKKKNPKKPNKNKQKQKNKKQKQLSSGVSNFYVNYTNVLSFTVINFSTESA